MNSVTKKNTLKQQRHEMRTALVTDGVIYYNFDL